MDVAKGDAHELPVIEDFGYTKFEINDGDMADMSFPHRFDIINMSASTHHNSEDTVRRWDNTFAPKPLFITSAGNGANECTEQAAEVGRTLGLSAWKLGNNTPEEHPDIDILYKACDMRMVAAVDLKIDENWIIVGADFGRRIESGEFAGKFSGGQTPGIYKHRWIAAPYRTLRAQGTSFGAPYVSYYASLIKSKMPHLEPENIAEIIFNTADKSGKYRDSDAYGHGLINPAGIETYLREQGYW